MTNRIPELDIPQLPEAVERLRAELPDDFPVQNLDPFSRWGTFLALAAQAGIDAQEFMAALIPHGFALTAQGDWQDLHAAGLSLNRIGAGRARGNVEFFVDYELTVDAGTVVQTGGAAGTELRFQVTEDTRVTAPSGLVPVIAEMPGTAHNVSGGRISTLVTLIPGVQRVENSPGWLDVRGIDTETDEQLRQRMLLRWPASGLGVTYHSYILQAREVAGIVKVFVHDEHPRGQGTADVVIAPRTGQPTPEQLAEAQALIEKRRPVTADILVRAPEVKAVDLSVKVHARTQRTSEEWLAVISEVVDALNIGEDFYPSTVLDALHNTGDIHGAELLGGLAPVVAEQASLIILGQVDLDVRL